MRYIVTIKLGILGPMPVYVSASSEAEATREGIAAAKRSGWDVTEEISVEPA